MTSVEVERKESPVLSLTDVGVFYGPTCAIRDVNLDIPQGQFTAFIGPSGCGKTSLLKSMNRLLDQSVRVEGSILYKGIDIYSDRVDPTQVRRRIGMVFQRPNPFPKSIYKNVAWGLQIVGRPKDEIEEKVEEALTAVGLWKEVAHRLETSALGLSGGQQQRLCIARALIVDPDTILMDEPTSSLDPRATHRLEEVVKELSKSRTIILVTHDLHQARRVADYTGFIDVDYDEADEPQGGRLIEFSSTEKLFGNPENTRTEQFIAGELEDH